MDPITNSPVKERYRQNNEANARNKEIQIQNKLSQDIASLQMKSKYEAKWFLICGGIFGIIIAFAGVGFSGVVIGLVIGLAIWIGLNVGVNNYNKNLEVRKQELQQRAQRDIFEAYNRADQETVRQINAYDNEVKVYSQKILKNAESISPMVDHVTNMFQRMISHADSGAHMRFIEADFVYQVVNTGITYSYQSRYTNPQDDYNYNRERYRDLKSEAECEGLAQALAKLTASKMKTLYPANSMKISVSHIDAKVTMHFQGANANFVPARDIL